MATASTAVLTALVALALGNLQMIDAMIDPCTTAITGTTDTPGLVGIMHYDLGVVNLPKFYKHFKIIIPSKGVCPGPVGVKMRVCDSPVGEKWEKPKVTYASFDLAYLSLAHNNDPDHNAFLKVIVYCVGVPYINGEGKDAEVTVVSLIE